MIVNPVSERQCCVERSKGDSIFPYQAMRGYDGDNAVADVLYEYN